MEQNDHIITLEEVERKLARKKWRLPIFIIKMVVLFIVLTLLIFFAINAPAYLKKGQFQSNPDQFNKLLTITPEQKQNTKLSELVLPILYPADLVDNTLYIPKISVKAPIIWNVDESDMMEQLTNGVTHYKSTALPGQIGNVFIFGHSSNYIWIKSQYNDVFALLDKVQVGDKIYLTYQGREYIYEVDGTKVVSPDSVNVMDATNDETITLMTCVPVGTSLNRLIVTAKQIAPKRNEQAELVLPDSLFPSAH